jgi:hypothetical protein
MQLAFSTRIISGGATAGTALTPRLKGGRGHYSDQEAVDSFWRAP